MFSTADWDAPYPTNKQQIARRLAERGHETLSLVEVYRVSKACAAAAWVGVALVLECVRRLVTGGVL